MISGHLLNSNGKQIGASKLQETMLPAANCSCCTLISSGPLTAWLTIIQTQSGPHITMVTANCSYLKLVSSFSSAGSGPIIQAQRGQPIHRVPANCSYLKLVSHAVSGPMIQNQRGQHVNRLTAICSHLKLVSSISHAVSLLEIECYQAHVGIFLIKFLHAAPFVQSDL